MTLRFINEIPSDMFTGLNEIGTGSCSNIFSATHVNTNTEVALKVSLIQNKEEINLMDQAITTNRTLNHPFICKFFTEFDTDHLRIISMELIDGISLLNYVNKKGRLTIPEAKSVFAQLLISIEYLHNEANSIHRDLKLENIMIDSHNHIRLIDFGFNPQDSTSPVIKSIPYCAPEVLSGQNFTKQSDIWSMGIILFSLVHGNLPFYNKDTKTLINQILNSNIEYPQHFESNLCDLLSKMLNKDPTMRITLDEIKLHPFIKNEKIFNIDYKRLFSPSQNSIMHLKCYKHDSNIKINTNSVSPIFRKSHFRSLYTPTTYNLKHDLHEKVNLKTDDVNLTIESRKNYSNSLNELIQSAFDPNSKYCLSQFKTRKGKISMATSCMHVNKNNKLYTQKLNKLKLQQNEVNPVEHLMHPNDRLPPKRQNQLKTKEENENSLSLKPLQNQMNSKDNKNTDSTNSLSSNPLHSQQKLNENEKVDSPMENLLQMAPKNNNNNNNEVDSPMETLLKSTENNVNDSPMEQLLRSNNSLPARAFQNQLKLRESEIANSPMEQLLLSNDALSSNPLRLNDSPMEQLLRSSDSFSSLKSPNQLMLNASSRENSLSQLLLSSESLTSRSSSSTRLDLSSSSGIKSQFSFRRIQAPQMALNRNPSIPRIQLTDVKNT